MLRLRLPVLFLPLAIVLACLSPSNSGGYTPAGASTTSSSKSVAEVLHHICAPRRSLLLKKALHEATVSTADQGAVASPPRRSLNKVPVPPSAPNPYIPASITSQSAAVGHSMSPPRRLLNKVPHVPPSAPNPYIPASITSQSAAVGHSMSPPRRLLNKVPHVPPSAPNPGTYIPASTTSQSAAVGHNMSPPRRWLKTAPDVPTASTANQSAFVEPLRRSLKNESVPPSAPNPGMHTDTHFNNLQSKPRRDSHYILPDAH